MTIDQMCDTVVESTRMEAELRRGVQGSIERLERSEAWVRALLFFGVDNNNGALAAEAVDTLRSLNDEMTFLAERYRVATDGLALVVSRVMDEARRAQRSN